MFLVLTAVCFRGLLDTLEAYILSLTPRALLAGLMLLCLLPGCFFGSAPISRMLSFYAPFASLLFLAVLLLALPHNAKLTNLFPLFGDGARRLAIDGSIGAVSYLWLFVLLIERRRCKRPLRTGLLSVALSALFLFVGYLSYSLLNAPGSPSETSAPLQQITTFSGYWRFFQRTQSVFVFAWAPCCFAQARPAYAIAGAALGTPSAWRIQGPCSCPWASCCYAWRPLPRREPQSGCALSSSKRPGAPFLFLPCWRL